MFLPGSLGKDGMIRNIFLESSGSEVLFHTRRTRGNQEQVFCLVVGPSTSPIFMAPKTARSGAAHGADVTVRGEEHAPYALSQGRRVLVLLKIIVLLIAFKRGRGRKGRR